MKSLKMSDIIKITDEKYYKITEWQITILFPLIFIFVSILVYIFG